MSQFGLDSVGVASVIMVEGITTTVTALLAAPLVQKLVIVIVNLLTHTVSIVFHLIGK